MKLIIADIFKEMNVKHTLVGDLILFNTKDGQEKTIFENIWPNNSASAYFLAKDKFLTHQILSKKNIPSLPQELFNVSNVQNNEEDFGDINFQKVYNYCKDFGFSVVMKPNTGSMGQNVFKISNENEYHNILTKFIKMNFKDINISKFEEIVFEFRVIILNGRVELIYSKQKLKVVGDGKSRIFDLISNAYFKLNNFKIKLDEMVEVLDKNKEKELDFRTNLSNGVIPQKIDSTHKMWDKLSEMAIASASALDLNFCSVDIYLNSQQELKVMEVNGGIMFKNFYASSEVNAEITKNILRKAIHNILEK